MIKLILPFPPSINGLFANSKHNAKQRFKSQKYKQWLSICPDLSTFKAPEPCTISYVMYFPDDRPRDGQNYMKATLDFMVSQSVLTDDNRKIVKGEQWIDGGIDRGNPRIEITIREFRNGRE